MLLISKKEEEHLMKTVFWNVDTQYDFMREDGALPVPDARLIEDNLERITQLAHTQGKQIINTADWHTPYSVEFAEQPDYKESFPPHCLQHSKGAQFIPATTPSCPYVVDWAQTGLDAHTIRNHEGDIILYKDAFDVFKGNPHTQTIVNIINPGRVVMYGVATNGCVNDAVNGLLKRMDEGNLKELCIITDAVKELPGCEVDKLFIGWYNKGATLIKTGELYKEAFWVGEKR